MIIAFFFPLLAGTPHQISSHSPIDKSEIRGPSTTAKSVAGSRHLLLAGALRQSMSTVSIVRVYITVCAFARRVCTWHATVVWVSLVWSGDPRPQNPLTRHDAEATMSAYVKTTPRPCWNLSNVLFDRSLSWSRYQGLPTTFSPRRRITCLTARTKLCKRCTYVCSTEYSK